jgi:hypothetical protein
MNGKFMSAQPITLLTFRVGAVFEPGLGQVFRGILQSFHVSTSISRDMTASFQILCNLSFTNHRNIRRYKF